MCTVRAVCGVVCDTVVCPQPVCAVSLPCPLCAATVTRGCRLSVGLSMAAAAGVLCELCLSVVSVCAYTVICKLYIEYRVSPVYVWHIFDYFIICGIEAPGGQYYPLTGPRCARNSERRRRLERPLASLALSSRSARRARQRHPSTASPPHAYRLVATFGNSGLNAGWPVGKPSPPRRSRSEKGASREIARSAVHDRSALCARKSLMSPPR